MKRLLWVLVLICAWSVPNFSQCLLAQSTASQTLTIGPFLNSTDGNTELNSLTIANTDIRIKKGSAAWASKNSGGATFREFGNYDITLDATDTATVGQLELYIHPATSLPVFRTCYVVDTTVFTAFYNSTAPGFVDGATVNTTKINGTTQTARDIGASVLLSNGTGAGQISLNTGAVTTGTLANGTISSATFSAGAINRAALAADTGLQPARSNTAQAGAATTITLDSGASATNDFYTGAILFLTGGTGVGQARIITGYVGSTKVATVATWAVNPDNTSTFAVLPFGTLAGVSVPTAPQVATAVWQDLLASSDFSTVASIGALLKANIDTLISSRLATSSISLAGGAVTVGTNNDKTGYTVSTVSDKTGYSLSTSGNTSAADAVLAEAIETNVTLRQAARLFVAALGGKTSGSGTATIVFRDTADTKNVISCSVLSGNRTSCTLNLN